MAHLYQMNKQSGAREPIPLRGNRFALVLDGEGNCEIRDGFRNGDAGAFNGRLLGIILALDAGSGAGGRNKDYLLLLKPRSEAEVLVNSDDDYQATGFRALADRDELLIGARERFYFTSEEPPQVVPFPEDPALADCACVRCKNVIEPGTPAVLCRCKVWHHQTAERPCYTYAEMCGCNGCDTDLGGGLTWSPEEI